MLVRWSSGLPLSNARIISFFCCHAVKNLRSAMWNWNVYISWRLKIHKPCMTGFYYALSTCSTRNILEVRIEWNKFGTVFVKRVSWIFKKHNYYWQPHLLIFYYSENVSWGKSGQNVLPQEQCEFSPFTLISNTLLIAW